jgi:pimeloyl-ACP methyl ester carboxylesterase
MFPLANVFNLLAHKLTCGSRGRLALLQVPFRSLYCFFLRHARTLLASLDAHKPRRVRSNTDGVPDPNVIAPEGYTLDTALIERPGNMDVQLVLFLDYANNVKLYAAFQEYFRKSKPPLLAIWGRNDPFFIPHGAKAYSRDNPNGTVQFLDTGHFALETRVEV